MRTVYRPLSALLAALALMAAGYGYRAYTVTGSANGSVSLTEQVPTTFGSTVRATVTPTFSSNLTYTSGTATNQVDVKLCLHDTIPASGADTFDLAGARTTEFGDTVTFAKIKVVSVKAAATNTNDVWLGGAAANRFDTALKDSSVVAIRPGYMFQLWGPGTGYTVTASTGDKLLFKNSAGSTPVVFDVCLGGTSS